MQPVRRRIEPPPDLDPLLAEFVAELARAAVRRQKWDGKETGQAQKRVLTPPAKAEK